MAFIQLCTAWQSSANIACCMTKLKKNEQVSGSIKFADDTTVVGLIRDNNESGYGMEVDMLTAGCRSHNLILNVDKTKEMVVNFRRANKHHQTPLCIDKLLWSGLAA